MIQKLRTHLKRASITDIITIGFMDIEENIATYYPNLEWLYFEIGEKLLECCSVEQYSKLRIKFTDKIQYQFEIDEDMSKANSSILNIVLIGGELMAGNNITQICLYNVQEKNENDIICDALRMTLANGQILFLDPTFLHGISIGGVEVEKFWRENQEDNKIIDKLEIQID